jgi:hypothetical protein
MKACSHILSHILSSYSWDVSGVLQSQAKPFQAQRSAGYVKVQKKMVRKAAGREWVDETLSEWPDSMLILHPENYF